eukprot:CAMPEP_0169145358 /NCGR_PEP_ID=MMETSP1015-20121227/46865_1 /TAXON_ID=342587 /ORGANISM="Karlodinium micrum, Strain CCMP2283" /LENGTH=212 /DNA_ID=CAMNT_0009212935 /DNA_START=205 /DNA_END=843 /DNA_ORIENTATION=+
MTSSGNSYLAPSTGRAIVRSEANRGGQHVNASLRSKVDCETGAMSMPTVTDAVSSYQWRLRSYAHCRGSDANTKKWEVTEVAFYEHPCTATATASPIPMEDIVSVTSSGETVANPGDEATENNPNMAMDQDESTEWLGVEDWESGLWIGITLSTPKEIKCVKFVQCTCRNSARAVVVEHKGDEGTPSDWQVVGAQETVTWGEETLVDVQVSA